LLEEGQGDLRVFPGRNVETTVANILYDDELLAFNDAAQARIDSERDVLAAELDLNDDDFIEMPVLYEPMPYGGYTFAAAYNPGVQNMVVAGQTLFIPDPEGPRMRGEDVWQRQIEDALEGTGNTVHFVDVFESYHLLLGEAHCGSNVEHSPFEALWWQP
jgi:protein-arginine deiminase